MRLSGWQRFRGEQGKERRGGSKEHEAAGGRDIYVSLCGLLLLLTTAAGLPCLAATQAIESAAAQRWYAGLGWAAIAGRRATCLLGARFSERGTIHGVHGLARVRPPPSWPSVVGRANTFREPACTGRLNPPMRGHEHATGRYTSWTPLTDRTEERAKRTVRAGGRSHAANAYHGRGIGTLGLGQAERAALASTWVNY